MEVIDENNEVANVEGLSKAIFLMQINFTVENMFNSNATECTRFLYKFLNNFGKNHLLVLICTKHFVK